MRREPPFLLTAIRSLSAPPHEFAAANFAVVGAPRHLHGGDDALAGKGGYGAAYIFRRSGKRWKQQIKLVAPEPALDDRFGEAVAIYRHTAVVGASKDDDNGKNSGSVFVYVFDGESWKPQAKIVPDDLAGSDAFGEAVSIDENTLAVGAPAHTHSGVRFRRRGVRLCARGEQMGTTSQTHRR